jgi:predicted Holliday junction resolvase-like endonuclease
MMKVMILTILMLILPVRYLSDRSNVSEAAQAVQVGQKEQNKTRLLTGVFYRQSRALKSKIEKGVRKIKEKEQKEKRREEKRREEKRREEKKYDASGITETTGNLENSV